MKKYAIILSGCGQHDGSETHEVVLTLLSLAQEGIDWEAFAPDVDQKRVVNHKTDALVDGEKRSVINEAARLVRGKIKPLNNADMSQFDGVVFPGGVGAVNTLCDWFENGTAFSFNRDVKKLIDQAVNQKKPMGFICIAPMMIPKIYTAAQLTIGNDKTLADQIHEMGSVHIDCSAVDVVVDEKNKVVSTPANMVAKNIDEVYLGIRKLVKEMTNL